MSSERGAKTPTEMAVNIGSEVVEPNQSWKSLSRFSFLERFANLGKQLGLDERFWQQITAQFGNWILQNLDGAKTDVYQQAKEKATIEKLRSDFGKPEDPNSWPIMEAFLKLATMESEAKVNLRQGVNDMMSSWQMIERKMTAYIQLFLASQLIQLEEQLSSKKKIVDNSEKMVSARPEIAGEYVYAKDILVVQIEKLGRQVEAIKKKIGLISSGLFSRNNPFFEQEVFVASRLTATPTTI